MKMLSKKRKKNNKGFSLVELIVVVLIIAIIAVALAPQVMKWVGTAKTNVDDNNMASIKSSIQIAIVEFESQGKTLKELGDVTIIIGKDETEAETEIKATAAIPSGTVIAGSDTTNVTRDKLLTIFKEILGGSYPTPSDTSKKFVVTIKVKEDDSKTILDRVNVGVN